MIKRVQDGSRQRWSNPKVFVPVQSSARTVKGRTIVAAMAKAKTERTPLTMSLATKLRRDTRRGRTFSTAKSRAKIPATAKGVYKEKAIYQRAPRPFASGRCGFLRKRSKVIGTCTGCFVVFIMASALIGELQCSYCRNRPCKQGNGRRFEWPNPPSVPE